MPPVLGPRSPARSRLWSCAGTRESTRSPSVRASTDTSSPSMNSSTSTWWPLSPKALPSSIDSMASSASARVSQTITPLPAASPEALITTGAP